MSKKKIGMKRKKIPESESLLLRTCPVCQNEFTRNRSMLTHMINVHDKLPEGVCRKPGYGGEAWWASDKNSLRPVTIEDLKYFKIRKNDCKRQIEESFSTETDGKQAPAEAKVSSGKKKKGRPFGTFKRLPVSESKINSSDADTIIPDISESPEADASGKDVKMNGTAKVKTVTFKTKKGRRAKKSKRTYKIEASEETVLRANGSPPAGTSTNAGRTTKDDCTARMIAGIMRRKKGYLDSRSKCISKIEPSEVAVPDVNEPPRGEASRPDEAHHPMKPNDAAKAKSTFLKRKKGSRRRTRKRIGSIVVKSSVSKIEVSEDAVPGSNGPPIADANGTAVLEPRETRRSSVAKTGAVSTPKSTPSSNSSAAARRVKLEKISGKTLMRVTEMSGGSQIIKWTVCESRREDSNGNGHEIEEDQSLESAALPAASAATTPSTTVDSSHTVTAPSSKRPAETGGDDSQSNGPASKKSKHSKNRVSLRKSIGTVSTPVAEVTPEESNGTVPTTVAQITSPSVVPNKKSSDDRSELHGNDFNMLGTMSRLVNLTREFPPPWNSDELLEKAREIFPDVEMSTLKMTILGIVTASRMCATRILSGSLRESLRQGQSERAPRCDKVHLDEQLTQSYMDSI